MTDFRDKNVTIGAVVAALPTASGIFDEFGIDFCCGGHRKVSDIVIQQGIDADQLYTKLEKAREERVSEYQGNDFTSMAPTSLSTYIEDTHHGYLRRVLPEVAELLNTILRVHGRTHTELFEVYRLFGTLKADLEQHLLKEETMLFPIFADEDNNKEEIAKITVDIIGEHEAAGEILEKLREVTNNYQLPEDACATYARAYDMLIEIEKDLHQHIHLENNILLKEYDNRKY